VKIGLITPDNNNTLQESLDSDTNKLLLEIPSKYPFERGMNSPEDRIKEDKELISPYNTAKLKKKKLLSGKRAVRKIYLQTKSKKRKLKENQIGFLYKLITKTFRTQLPILLPRKN